MSTFIHVYGTVRVTDIEPTSAQVECEYGMATQTGLCTQISEYGMLTHTRLCNQISEYSFGENHQNFKMSKKKSLVSMLLVNLPCPRVI